MHLIMIFEVSHVWKIQLVKWNVEAPQPGVPLMASRRRQPHLTNGIWEGEHVCGLKLENTQLRKSGRLKSSFSLGCGAK